MASVLQDPGPPPPMSDVLRRLREQVGMTQTLLALLSQVDIHTIAAIEDGAVPLDAATARRLVEVMGHEETLLPRLRLVRSS